MEQDKKEVCTMQIMFPIDSDEKAIECKKKIEEVLSDNPDAEVRFSISKLRVR